MGNCEHCAYFQIEMVQGPNVGDRLIGHCRRFPPTEGRPKPLKSEEKNIKLSHWPLVRGSDWCGEFLRTTTPMRRMSAWDSAKPVTHDMRLVVSGGEAANLLGVSEKHLYMLSTKADLPRVRIGKRVCYRLDTLKAWLAAHESVGRES